MLNFPVKTLQDNRLVDTTFNKLVEGKKVIVCPNIKTEEKITLEYLKYLHSLYDTHILDDIIIIDSSGDNFFHMFISSYFPKFTTVTDTEKVYISLLRKEKKNKAPLNVLKNKWIFQQLLDHGKEIGFWEQPLYDHWKHLIKNKRVMKILMKTPSLREAMREGYQNRHNTNVWALHTHLLMDYGVEKNKNMQNLLSLHGPLFFYFNLFGNKTLESMLTPINTL